jgi:tellurite resistance protein TehA-like permease
VATCFYLPFVMYVHAVLEFWRLGLANLSDRMYFHKTELSTMTAAWLLPIVAPIVAAASGGIVAEVLPNPQYALWTIIVSYILWGTGVPLAMAVLVIYFQRLTVYKLPPREVIVSVFLPLGPLGQGGFGVMQLGSVAQKIFPTTHTLPAAAGEAGRILYVMGWLMAIIMWGFGLVWLFFALASITRSRFPFNMGWWGFTFPLGVFTVSTTTIGKELPSRFFDVLGTVSTATCVQFLLLTLFQIFSVFVILLWILVAFRTATKAFFGQLIFAPCLKDLEGKEKEGETHFAEKKRFA